MRKYYRMRAQAHAALQNGGSPHATARSDVIADACSAANKEAPVNEVEFNDGGQGDEDDLPQTFSDDGDVEGQPIPRATRCEGVEQTPRVFVLVAGARA